MTSETGTGSDSGQTISLTIPVQDPELFNFGATNDVLILLTNNRYEDYTIRELAKYTDYAFVSVRKATTRLRNEVDDIVGIVLFGSVARGEADRRSDLDLWDLTDGDRGADQREANQIARDLEEATFDGQRYDYQVDVEGVQSIPRYTENIREIIGTGIPLYETETFQKVKALLQAEGLPDG